MKALRLRESYTQYTVGRNAYGDEELAKVGSGICLFRNISQLNRGVNFREEVQIHGIFWFAPTDPHYKGDVIGYQGQLYRLEQIIIGAQRLTTDTVHFYKCTASLLRQIS